MDLLWLLLFVGLVVALGGLLMLCDRWLAPTKALRRRSQGAGERT